MKWTTPPGMVVQAVPAARLSRLSLVDLLAGASTAVHATGVLPPDVLEDAVQRVAQLPPWHYPGQPAVPGVAAYGPSLKWYVAANACDLAPYWRDAERCHAQWGAALGYANPVEHAVGVLRSAWGQPVVRAKVAGRPLYRGILRESRQGAGAHTHAPLDDLGPRLLDGGPYVRVLMAKLALCVPARGGRTVLHPRTVQPQDVALDAQGAVHPHATAQGEVRWYSLPTPAAALPPGTGPAPDLDLDPGLLAPVPDLDPQGAGMQVPLAPGDMFLHDATRYHSVQPVTDGRRLMVEFFVGLTADGALETWS